MLKSRALKKPDRFIFKRYVINRKDNSVSFFYALAGSGGRAINFREEINLGAAKINWRKINQKLLAKLLFNLQLALGVSYYKTYCPRKIIIKNGSLTPREAEFWNKLYTKGLGEFFYKNKIDFRGLVNFPTKRRTVAQPLRVKFRDRSLLPLGGGKDSCLAGERLKALGHDFDLFSLGDSEAQRATAKVIGRLRLIFKRTMDPQLFALNRAGVYNGHVPSTAIYSFAALLAAVLGDYSNIILANEASASYGNIKYLGENINHQYSKSLEFENDFRAYLKDSIAPDINYFSLLRPYSEFKISSEFAGYPKYFSAFVSCNRHFSLVGSRTRWCGECPKCAFVFSQLAAFRPRAEVIKIFGKNLFADRALLPLFQELWGEKRFKPFECVGEPKEVAAALLLAGRRADWRRDFIVNYFSRVRAPKIKDKASWLADVLRLAPEHNVPRNFQKILILGYGHEGRFAAQYLNGHYPTLKFAIADAKPVAGAPKQATVFSGPNYLETTTDYEVIIKSPGVSDRLPAIATARDAGKEITTVTNIFLKQLAARTIGVTGTKGKSTTASLIYKMLRANGLKAELVGNIGADPLKYLNGRERADKIFVYELSSYQLSTAVVSPRVAVFINIFPDHLPYHGGLSNYFQAKTNIARHQKTGDRLIYNSAYVPLRKLAATSRAQKIDYLKKGAVKNGWLCYAGERILPLNEIHLLGRHNLENILAAIGAVKVYGVKNVAIRRALKNFRNLPHRLEFVGRRRGIDFYDDAISTTPESTLAALTVFKDRLGTIILGGENRGYNFSDLAKILIRRRPTGLVLFPDSGKQIAAALKKAARQTSAPLPRLLSTSKMEAAVKFCYRHTPIGKVCLLSTASPSYSLFKNFEDKGDQFQKAVKKYAKKL